MTPPLISTNEEKKRIAALQNLELLGTVSEERFDRITRLAAYMANTPIALLTLVGDETVWIKSEYGYNISELPREVTFCTYNINQEPPLIIPDTHLDPRFTNNLFVTGKPFIRFYVGFALHSPDGYKVGTLSVLDTKPRFPNKKELEMLGDLAKQAEEELKATHLAVALNERDRMAHLLLGQNLILEAIARGVSLQETMGQLARFIERQRSGLLCSVLRLEKNEGEPDKLRFLAGPSLPMAYSQAIDNVAVGPAVGSCGTAVYYNKRIIVSDIENDPLWENFRDLALSYDLRACWSTPIVSTQGEILGTFGVYYRTTRQPDKWEVQLLDVASYLASIAMEQVQVKQRLNESEIRYKTIFDTSLDAIFINGLDGRTYAANSAACQLLNYSEEELMNLGRVGIIDNTDPRLTQLLEELNQRGHSRGELNLVRKDKSIVSCEVSMARFTDQKGQYRNSVFVRDISEHLKSEQKLQSYAHQQAVIAILGQEALSNPQVQTLMDQAVALVAQTLEVEEVGILELINGGQDLVMQAGFGYDQLKVEKDTNLYLQSRYTLLTQEPVICEDLSQETRFQPAENAAKPAMISSASVLIWNPQEAYGVLNVFTSTRRRFSEEEIHFLQVVSNVLAAAIQRQRSAKSLLDSQEQLRQSQKMEAVGRLAGGIAHDFNNILSAILAYSELSLYNLDEPLRLKNSIEQIQLATDRAANLTRQLLAFSRRQFLTPQVVNLGELVADLEKMLHRLIGENINLVTKFDKGLDLIKADPNQIQQIIMNLAVNSRDAMPLGGFILIETGNINLNETYFANKGWIAKPGAYVRLTVTDTGHGMDTETISHIYEPFYTTKPPGKGTGLGLSTVYGIMTQSEGYIEVESKLEQGTTFRLYFPAVRGADPLLTGTTKPGALEPIEENKKNHTILLVEDEESVRASTFQILNLLGYEVIMAANGEEALTVSQAYSGEIDLVVTDVIMPRLNGPGMVERLKKLRPGIKALFISGYIDRDNVGLSSNKEDTNLLHKPFSIKSLSRKIQEILSVS